MRKLAMIKSETEILLLQKACDITESAFRRVLKFVKAGVKEYEIEAEIIHEFIRSGASGHGYSPIIGSGKNYTVKEFCKKVFKYLNLDFKKYLKINKKFLRKGKNSNLKSDISKAKKAFGYKPKTDLDKLIKIMVDDCLRQKN